MDSELSNLARLSDDSPLKKQNCFVASAAVSAVFEFL